MADFTLPATAVKVCNWSTLEDRKPTYALVANVDLVVTRFDDRVSVFYGRCLHRGALLSDGFIRGEDLICGVHDWDYRLDTGISAYNNEERLPKFNGWVDVNTDAVYVDEKEISDWEAKFPQSYQRDKYLGLYADHTGTEDEPHVNHIQKLAQDGLSKVGRHGPVSAMGVPTPQLPKWDDIQILTAQLATLPLLDDANNCPVGIATQREDLRARIKIEASAKRLQNFFKASTKLMKVMACACGHSHLSKFCLNDLSTWHYEVARLTGTRYAGVAPRILRRSASLWKSDENLGGPVSIRRFFRLEVSFLFFATYKIRTQVWQSRWKSICTGRRGRLTLRC